MLVSRALREPGHYARQHGKLVKVLGRSRALTALVPSR
jgi:hypothetical protein